MAKFGITDHLQAMRFVINQLRKYVETHKEDVFTGVLQEIHLPSVKMWINDQLFSYRISLEVRCEGRKAKRTDIRDYLEQRRYALDEKNAQKRKNNPPFVDAHMRIMNES